MRLSLARRATPAAVSPSRHSFVGFASLLLALLMWSGCGGGTMNNTSSSSTPSSGSGSSPSTPPPAQQESCPPVTLAEAQGPTTGVAPFPAPGPVPPPNPGSTASGSVCVSEPANNATVTSPFPIVAAATLVNPIDHMRVYVDGMANYFTFYNTVNAQMWMDPGAHNLEVLATDKNGNNVSTTFAVTVVAPPTPSITGIQNLPGWQPCSALFPPGDPRAGQICAAGLGEAQSTMTENQQSPSLSGSSAKFSIGGSHPYSNELYTKFLGGGRNVSQFTYDLSFYIDQPERAQALEFDVNQTFDNMRWVFGTECNFKADGKWDVWDGVNGWEPTSVPCQPFPSNTWIHLVWQFERVGNQVHYISVSVNGQTYPVNLYKSNEHYWTMEDIDVAFQMDGDYAQQPYSVWLDNVTLTAQ
jgi:hypothetical protein